MGREAIVGKCAYSHMAPQQQKWGLETS